jgi:hypothetical protein
MTKLDKVSTDDAIASFANRAHAEAFLHMVQALECLDEGDRGPDHLPDIRPTSICLLQEELDAAKPGEPGATVQFALRADSPHEWSAAMANLVTWAGARQSFRGITCTRCVRDELTFK